VIEAILPRHVVAVEAFGEPRDVGLFAEEAAVIQHAGEQRRRDFTAGRACARRALQVLGHCSRAIPSGTQGEPRWPRGVVGSITHCAGYRACAAARSTTIVTVGIDAEPHQRLPDDVDAVITQVDERAMLRRLSDEAPHIHWGRVLFSAKEAVYKAWYPLTGRWLGFEDVVLTIDRDRETFAADLLVPGPLVDGVPLETFSGRWHVNDGLLVTAVAASRQGPAPI
jgi:4'-phosphopantetheinyl transferase EntD